MKKLIIYTILLLISFDSFSQKDTLFVKRLDSVVFVDEPEIISNEVMVENIINDYREAIGGEKNLKKFKNVIIKETVSINNIIYNIIKYYEFPDKMTKILSSMGSRIEKIVYDGNKARTWGVKGYRIIEDEELEALKYESTIFLPLFLEKYKFELSYDTTEFVDGLEAHKITGISKNQDEYIFHFDAVNGHLLRLTLHEIDDFGEPTTLTIDYNNYTEVEGFEFPEEITHTRDDLVVNFKVTLINVNSRIDKDIFLLKE